MIPALFFCKITNNSTWSLKLKFLLLDFLLVRLMPYCDVFIGLGTVYKNAFKKAKSK